MHQSAITDFSRHQITITGVPPHHDDIKGRPALRREINDIITDKKQWPLYIQAIQKLMEESQKGAMSWFGIGGIHGLPYEAWDNANGKTKQNIGYCTHGSNLFPTWHRAYVILFEQALQAHAASIAEKYKDNRAEWLDAARTLRSPYWDWASNVIPPDEVIRKEELEIETPEGKKVVKNPLYAYNFHPIHPSFTGSFAGDIMTVRNPVPGSPSPRVSKPDALVESLRHYDARSNTFNMLTRIKEWRSFSNHTAEPGIDPVANSLEEIHDTIHGLVGGGGHMSSVAYAAFDPIFWLHHTNVDRMLALWQALNPYVWVTPDRQPHMETWTIPKNTTVDTDTDLTPFWNGAETFWKSASNAVREWVLFNQQYPEFVDLVNKTPEERSKVILNTVKRLYEHKQSFESARVATENLEQKASTVVANIAEQAALFVPSDSDNKMTIEIAKDDFLDWFVRIRSARFAFDMTYTVLVFLDEPPASEAEWRISSALVGYHTVFVSSRADLCSNCQAQAQNIDEGIVHITRRLRADGVLSKSEEEIEAYVKKILRWRIQKMDATVVPAEEVASLEVAVMTVLLKWSEENEIYYLPAGTHPIDRNLTSDQPGGRASA